LCWLFLLYDISAVSIFSGSRIFRRFSERMFIGRISETVPERILREDLIRSEIPPSNNLSRNWVYRPRFDYLPFANFTYRESRSLTLMHIWEEQLYLLWQNGADLIFGWLICRKAPCSDNGRSCKSHRKIMPVATYVCKTININASQK